MGKAQDSVRGRKLANYTEIQTQETEKVRVGSRLRSSKPAPSDVLPSARFHLLKGPKFPRL